MEFYDFGISNQTYLSSIKVHFNPNHDLYTDPDPNSDFKMKNSNQLFFQFSTSGLATEFYQKSVLFSNCWEIWIV